MKNRSVARRIALSIAGLLLGISIYLYNAERIAGNDLPMPFGIGVSAVLSGSMEPEIMTGDLAVIKSSEDYDVGDIVVYSSQYELIIHRIVDINGEKIVTKGDANNVNDSPVDKSDIKGKMIFHIPYLGKAAMLVKQPFSIVILILSAVILLSLSSKNKDDEAEKLKKEIEDLKKKINS